VTGRALAAAVVAVGVVVAPTAAGVSGAAPPAVMRENAPSSVAAPAVAPGVAQHVEWDGLTGGDEVAAGGRYRIRVAGPVGTARNAGRLTLRSHIYPIRGRHADRGGVVTRAGYDPVLYGNIVIIRGSRTRRDYWYAHLLAPSPLQTGDRVTTGQRIGRVGATGNARTIGCHLHLEIRSRGVPIDPAPELHEWDAWS
jgi:hypothetical protein